MLLNSSQGALRADTYFMSATSRCAFGLVPSTSWKDRKDATSETGYAEAEDDGVRLLKSFVEFVERCVEGPVS